MLRHRTVIAGTLLALALANPPSLRAEGLDFSDYEVAPWQADLGHWGFKLRGMARGAAYHADQPDFAGLNASNVTGFAELSPSLTRVYDTGMTLSLNAKLSVWHDRLSGDDYDNDLFAEAYAALRTGLGRFEAGMTMGPAYTMTINGPHVLPEVSIDGFNTSFFLDPVTGAGFAEIFGLQSSLSSTANYSKLVYYSPEILGVKVGLAFTPSTAKDVIPFVFAARKTPNRQEDFWEFAIDYTATSDDWTFSSYAAFVFAHNGAKIPGGAGLTDWGFGAQADYVLDEETSLSLGGGFRETNAYALDTFSVGASGTTQSMRGAFGVTHGKWIAVAEYAHGRADQPGRDTLGVDGLGLSAGYVFNENLQLTAGWQSLRYRTSAAFYDGSKRLRLDAFFLHASFSVDDPY